MSVLKKLRHRIQSQGPFGLLSLFLIKAGVYCLKAGHGLEHSIANKIRKKLNQNERRFDGVLDLIRASYLQQAALEINPAQTQGNSDDRTVYWVVPPFNKGSGGHTTIFRFVRGLEKLGVKNKILLLNDSAAYMDAGKVKEDICDFFFKIDADVELLNLDNLQRNVGTLICTSWQTAYAAKVINASRKIYFMQDFEPYFSPVGAFYFFAEETYRMGFEYFTAGPWLLKRVKEQYSGQGDFFYLCPEYEVYYPRTSFQLEALKRQDTTPRTFKIGVYNRSQTARRCVELVWVALDILTTKGLNLEIVTFGDDTIKPLPFPTKQLGILSHDQLAEVYSYCDVIIAPSATNLSLLAREVMACGGVVLDLLGENTEIELFDGRNSLLCRPSVDSFVTTLEKYALQPQLLLDLKQEILQNIKNLPSWDEQFKHFYNFLTGSRSI